MTLDLVLVILAGLQMVSMVVASIAFDRIDKKLNRINNKLLGVAPHGKANSADDEES